MPFFSILRSRSPRLWAATLSACVVFGWFAPVVQAEEPIASMRLRVAWGGNAPVRWAGHVSLSEGELEGMELLGRERDTPGSIWLDQGEVRFLQPGPRRFDGFDITARASPSARLRIEFRSAGDQPPVIVETTLAELMTHPLRSSIDENGNTLLVHRAQDDALRLKVADDDLIFSPGELLRFTVKPAIEALEPGGSFDLAVEMVEGRGGASVWSKTERVTLSARGALEHSVEIPLPERDGVYTVRLIARTPPGNRGRFWEGKKGNEQLAQRSFQVVVLGEQPKRSGGLTDWQIVREIDPANPRWWNRLPDWVRLDRWAGGGSGPMGSEPVGTSEWQGRTLAQIAASKDDAPSWQGYPLPGAQPGKLHVVEIDLPNDAGTQLALRIFEPDAEGKLVAIGPGGGAATDAATDAWPPIGEQASGKKKMAKYRYLFWPKTNSPVLVVQNANNNLPARYGSIRLRVAREETAQAEPIHEPADERAVVAYFSWEGLVARMGVRRLDARGRPATDDWVTFYQTAVRLADYLEIQGYNGAVVNVFADGGSACNCGTYPATPLLNSCRLTSGMNDLPSADPLEIMLQVFERRGLRLTPTLRFTSSLPAVEAGLREGRRPGEELPLWTSTSGRPRMSVSLERRSGTPYYKLSHDSVAMSIREVIDSIVSRYGKHKAFAGLGLELTEDSYLPLPPAPYGVTRSKLVRLAKEMNQSQEELDTWLKDPRLAFANPAIRRHWNAMRAAPITEFYRSVASRLRKQRPDAVLLLLTEDLLASREYSTALQPRLARSTRLEDAYLERGVAIQELRRVPGIALPLVQHDAVAFPLADAALSMELNHLAMNIQNNPSAASHPTLEVRHPRWLPMPRFQDSTGATPRPAKVLFDRVGASRGKQLLETLRDNRGGPIIIGGELGPGFGSEADRELLRLVRQLPDASDEKASDLLTQQPVAARAYRSNGKTFCVVINPSPWPVEVSATLAVDQKAEGRPWTGSSETAPLPSTIYAPGQHAWSISLAPFSAEAVEFSSERVSLAGLRMRLPAEVDAQLAARCDQLERRDLKPDRLPAYALLENPSFENVGEGGLPTGWIPVAGIAETATPGADGERALRLVATGEVVSIASQPFAVPPTGQIALTAYVKAIDIGDDAELRLILEEVESNAPPRGIARSADRLLEDREEREWNGYRFGIENLPLNSFAQMRVRLELAGKGEVWIDDIKLHQLVYPLDLYEAESRQQVLALVQHLQQTRAALDERRYGDCQELLDSYWSQFLLAYLPEIEEESVARPAEAGPPPDEKTPKLTDRVRDLFRF